MHGINGIVVVVGVKILGGEVVVAVVFEVYAIFAMGFSVALVTRFQSKDIKNSFKPL